MTGSATALDLPANTDWHRLPPHPRLLADAARVPALKMQDNPVSKQLLALLRQDAEEKFAAGSLVYPAEGFILSAVRQVQGRILTLAMQHRLTGDPRCLERARAELRQLADLPDWHPGHFLDAGEAALAAGIGLDWLYDDLLPSERDHIGRAIVNNALIPSLEAVEGVNGWVDGDYNWNSVCHAGLIVGALAVAEREPALARRVVERAVRFLPNAEATYAPDGSYPEGPSYWAYGTTFHVIAVEALRSAFGTSYGLGATEGFLKTADFIQQMVGPSGEEYNFSDYHCEHQNRPVLLWLARERRSLMTARAELDDLARMEKAIRSGSPQVKSLSRHLALEVLWWDGTLADHGEARPRHWTAGGKLPLAVLRSAWDDPRATWVAVKGGTPNGSHAHMDVGGFVLESDGVRWAVDLGTERYDLMRAARIDLWDYAQDSSRWTTFRVGPDGHNILRFNGARQDVGGQAGVSAFALENGDFGNTVALSSLYRSHVERVERRVTLHGDRSVTIEDEWTAGPDPVAVSWQWLTRAAVTRIGTGLLLRQQGRALTLTVTAGVDTAIDIEDVSWSGAAQDSPNPGLTCIVIRLKTAQEHAERLCVRAEPGATRSESLFSNIA